MADPRSGSGGSDERLSGLLPPSLGINMITMMAMVKMITTEMMIMIMMKMVNRYVRACVRSDKSNDNDDGEPGGVVLQSIQQVIQATFFS